MDASDLNSRRDDDDVLDTNVNGWGSPEDVRYFYAQRDPALVENVGVYKSASTFLKSKLLHSAPICVIEWRHFKTSLHSFGTYFQLYVVPFDSTLTLIQIL